MAVAQDRTATPTLAASALEQGRWDFWIDDDHASLSHFTGESPEPDFMFQCELKTKWISAMFEIGERRPPSGWGHVYFEAGEHRATVIGPLHDHTLDGVNWIDGKIRTDHPVFTVLAAAADGAPFRIGTTRTSAVGLKASLHAFMTACR